jgi:hypothetical protein
MEMVTTKRKGRMTRAFFNRCPMGSLAKRAMLIRAVAKIAKKRKEAGGELTPTNIKLKKTMIFALASR